MEQSRTVLGRGSLPVELTQFIGRAAELAALRQLVGSARLLTLTGAGGSGKSRLALALTPHLAAVAPAGVAWVELAPLADAQLIAGEVLRALGSPTEGAASVESVASVLRERQAALVLDNCEHLVEGCAVFADTLLRACPRLCILATSREALGVMGERAWLVPPLGVPEPGAPVGVLQASDAVRLFVDRARDVFPEFALTADITAVVAAICARLDGIPLAIELAAARVRHMSAEQILDRLSDAFALLTTGARTALPRHRTLRATLDWSHDLLPPAARTMLRRLAVFRGGFTLDAAEAVVAGDGIAAGDVLDLLATLVDRSLVVVREQHAVARYQLLETVRQYAQQRLHEANEEERTMELLAAHVSAVVEAMEPAFITTARRTAFNTLEPELDNIREVLHWTREHGPQRHVRLVGMLWWFWFSTRHWIEAGRWISDALALPDAAAPTRDRAALVFAAGALASLRGQVADAQPRLEEASSLAAQLGDERLEAYALNYLGMVYGQQGRVEGRDYSGRAERWFRAHDDPYGLRLALLLVAMAERAAGNAEAAMTMTREAVDIARRFGQDRELAVALQNLVILLIDEQQVTAARTLILESLHALRRDPSYLFIYRGIDYYASTIEELEPRAAAYMMGAAESVREHIAAKRFRLDQDQSDALIVRLRARLGDEGFERAHAEGRAIPATEVLGHILDMGDPAAAAGAAAAAGSAATTRGAGPTGRGSDMQPVVGGGSGSADSGAVAVTAVPAADLIVRALGPFEAVVRGQPIGAWPYAKPRELLVHLLCHPQGRTRLEIGASIWPDAAPSQVRNSFHVTLHHLRKTLGEPEWIVIESDRYRIAREVVIDFDVTVFERDVRAGVAAANDATPEAVALLRRALAQYRDHFLAGETAAPWRDELQDRLRRLYCDAGVRLGALLAEAGDVAGAVATFEAVILREPLHEEAHRGLLLAWTQAGRRAHALRHYERLIVLMRDELDMDPEPETVELYGRIRAADIVARA
jgi:predicted ATPase/DNA-binding SARP family transcriptional activator